MTEAGINLERFAAKDFKLVIYSVSTGKWGVFSRRLNRYSQFPISGLASVPELVKTGHYSEISVQYGLLSQISHG